MGLLDGRVAIVTGAGSSLGRVTAQVFAREGARVVVADWKQDTARETVASIEAEGHEALCVATHELDRKRWDRCLAVTLTGVWLCLEYETPGMAAYFEAYPEIREHTESQHAMRGFGRPEEIADAVTDLCSDRASFVTGQVLGGEGGIQVNAHDL